jgi:hypothetical protein
MKPGRGVSSAPPNNGMHPTLNSVAFISKDAGGRVMPGVRPLRYDLCILEQ